MRFESYFTPKASKIPTIMAILLSPIEPDIYIGTNYFTTVGASELKQPTQIPCKNLPTNSMFILGTNIRKPPTIETVLKRIKL
jgi:hypothetical protein